MFHYFKILEVVVLQFYLKSTGGSKSCLYRPLIRTQNTAGIEAEMTHVSWSGTWPYVTCHQSEGKKGRSDLPQHYPFSLVTPGSNRMSPGGKITGGTWDISGVCPCLCIHNWPEDEPRCTLDIFNQVESLLYLNISWIIIQQWRLLRCISLFYKVTCGLLTTIHFLAES